MNGVGYIVPTKRLHSQGVVPLFGGRGQLSKLTPLVTQRHFLREPAAEQISPTSD